MLTDDVGLDGPTVPLPKLSAGVLACCARGSWPAHDLASLASTCRTLRDAASTAAFWARLDLSVAAQPLAFFEAGLSSSTRFAGVCELQLQFCDGLRDAHLRALPAGLRRLTLDACHAVTDDGVKALAASCGKRLELLSIYWNVKLTNSSAIALSLRCPSLTSLSLSGCTGIGASGVLSLASRCRRLTALNLTRLPLVDDVALSTVLQANPAVRELRLFASSQYTDAPLLAAASSCAGLAVLDVTGLGKLTDGAAIAIGSGCRRLRELYLTWCKALTDAGVCAVARGCPLASLSVHGLDRIGPASLGAIVEHLAPTLVEIDVRGCVGIPNKSPDELVAVLPKLRQFILHRG